ncbi:hypothetical protein FDI24_gp057 [Acidovorax phage ACP17]|uniref:Uncharacterized protein n=1 Tax=Acidovorax phage ACP17 TaxID=2010329 RepID=A0A218M3G1_9CAUD|nr:hypothetical protein FDI24_gp057 [Acidovorax phage ACP17]ASD50584.1 hypothetical protein [Acidovorax phage ACP17]
MRLTTDIMTEIIKFRDSIFGASLHRFIAAHADYDRKTQLWTVRVPMKVYKKTRDECIVELEIPAGAQIYARSRRDMASCSTPQHGESVRKMRCSSAKVLQQWYHRWYREKASTVQGQVDGEKHHWLTPTATSRSKHNWEFIYHNGKTVVPEGNFAPACFEQCASGIHFFVNVQDAINY